MNKYIVLCIVFVLAIVLIIVIKYVTPNNSPKEENNPKELVLTYKMNAGIPFKRIYEIEDESIVEFVRSYVKKDENTGAIVGAPIYTSYIFKGLKEGETIITFKVVSITDDNDIMSEDTNKIQVDKDGNISLINNQENE